MTVQKPAVAAVLEPLQSRDDAELLDAEDPLQPFRQEFIIPTKRDIQRKTLDVPEDEEEAPPCIYLCGNSLGLQPKKTRANVDRFLHAWATKGVLGHFTPHRDQDFPPWLDLDDKAAELMAPVVGALPAEVAVMNTLTGNLHLLMACLYRPTKQRYKIILEGKAFPSDHFAVQSQIELHGLDPAECMVFIEPEDEKNPILTTDRIFDVICEHADTSVLILLPGIQYYTGQYFDIGLITEYAHASDLLIGWDLAHAVGNVELELREWNVDFAAWCTYKYLNSGPGSIGGLFINERHGSVEAYKPRFSGWWGSEKRTRFRMDNVFTPRDGAAGFQLSNPSAIDMTSVLTSLEIFNKATMPAVRKKSIELTAYLEKHLRIILSEYRQKKQEAPFVIITPTNRNKRGAQLSVRLKAGLMENVFAQLLENGVIVDERKPDVIRISPAPLYNSFADIWDFAQCFTKVLRAAVQERAQDADR